MTTTIPPTQDLQKTRMDKMLTLSTNPLSSLVVLPVLLPELPQGSSLGPLLLLFVLNQIMHFKKGQILFFSLNLNTKSLKSTRRYRQLLKNFRTSMNLLSYNRNPPLLSTDIRCSTMMRKKRIDVWRGKDKIN